MAWKEEDIIFLSRVLADVKKKNEKKNKTTSVKGLNPGVISKVG